MNRLLGFLATILSAFVLFVADIAFGVWLNNELGWGFWSFVAGLAGAVCIIVSAAFVFAHLEAQSQ